MHFLDAARQSARSFVFSYFPFFNTSKLAADCRSQFREIAKIKATCYHRHVATLDLMNALLHPEKVAARPPETEQCYIIPQENSYCNPKGAIQP